MNYINPVPEIPGFRPLQPQETGPDTSEIRHDWEAMYKLAKEAPFQAQPPGPRPPFGYVLDPTPRGHVPADLLRNPKQWTDQTYAADFAGRHFGQICYVPETGFFHVWNGHLWERDVRGVVEELYKEYADGKKLERDLLPANQQISMTDVKALCGGKMRAILNLVKTDARISAPLVWFDNSVEEVNTPGGVVDLRTGIVAPPDPTRLFRRATAVEPDWERPTPEFDKFLSRTFAGMPDVVKYVQIMLGISLIGAQDTQTFLYCYGSGANGKGVLLTLAQRLLGIGEAGYAITVNPSLIEKRNYDKHETEIAQLHGVRMAVTSEAGTSDSFDTNKVKRLISGENLSGRFMGKDYFTFAPAFTLWVMSNNKLKADAADSAFWRRLREIDFLHTVPANERIDSYGDDLFSFEGPGILAWMIDGAREYLENGVVTPQEVRDAGEAYIQANETVGAWFEDCTTTEGGPQARYLELYESYSRWCRLHGSKPVEDKSLRLELEKMGFVKHKSNGYYGFKGLSLAPQTQ